MVWLKPTMILPRVTDIDLDHLAELGVKGFIFDLDNTLMRPNLAVLPDDIAQWLKELKARGFAMAVVSNNKSAQYVAEAQKVLDFPCVARGQKPGLKYLTQAMEAMGLTPGQIVVVGDRPLTDIWGGFRLGAHTILVDSLSHAEESKVIRLLRRMERLVIKKDQKTTAIS